MKTELEAVNGKKMQALEVFAHALRFFKQHAVQVGPPGTQPGLPAPPHAFSLPECHVVLSTCCFLTHHQELRCSGWGVGGSPAASCPAGAEGPVPVPTRARCHPLGDHCAGHLEAAGQAVHAGGCLQGEGTPGSTSFSLSPMQNEESPAHPQSWLLDAGSKPALKPGVGGWENFSAGCATRWGV